MMNTNEPIIKFKTKKQFDKCVEWWMDKLNLNDWYVVAVMVDRQLNCEEPDTRRLGQTIFNFVSKQAKVYIDNTGDVCAELTIVHELLHLLVPFMQINDEGCTDSSDSAFKSQMLHQSLEEMAKTLLLVKYKDITKEFFMFELDTW